ncbi:MAG: MATE family efflux transporter [Clostridia bacterium]|nr:MATE family efflux transporter [Clostridia bacterium]
MGRAKKEVNMTEGPFLKKIILFVIPLILTGLLQCFYNAADLAVIGQFRGELALAAVGSTGALTNLIVGLFMGLSAGVGVVVAYYMGAMRYKTVSRVVHNSILIAAILGVVVTGIGVALAPMMLQWMDTPAAVLPGATRYIRIIFCGIPASMMYNYCAAMLRSTGDTKHPLIFLSISGVVNVALNLFFVVICGMDVEGVALATILSQYLSAVMVLVYMARTDGVLKFSFRKLRLNKLIIKKILAVGIPSGIQSSLFSLSNVMIQSSINFYGDVVVAGNAAGGNLEGFVYIAMNAMYHAALTFVGQNVGAKKYENVKRITLYCAICAAVIGIAVGGIILLFGEFFVGIYASEPEVITAGLTRNWAILPFYWMCGVMEALCGAIRGMGKSMTTMVISLLGACVLRVVWCKTLAVWFRTIHMVYWCWPVSWTVVIAASIVAFIYFYRQMVQKQRLASIMAREHAYT